MSSARVAIVGSRDWADPCRVRAYVVALPVGTTVISGTEPNRNPLHDRGVDQVAIRAARARGLDTVVFSADWDRHGNAAGPIRNRDIAANCTRLVAFWDGVSRGTDNVVRQARNLGRPVEIIGP